MDGVLANHVVDALLRLRRTPRRPRALRGGLSEGLAPADFDPEQVRKGILVELEHTKEPVIALMIAMDHLTEIPDYYDRLAKMEAEAKRAWKRRRE